MCLKKKDPPFTEGFRVQTSYQDCILPEYDGLLRGLKPDAFTERVHCGDYLLDFDSL